MDAAIWKGNDEEVVASAMDSEDHLGRVWLIFFHGTQPYKNAQFRIALTSEIHQFWPAARSLPIMPDGAIPNVSDLIRTPSGYVVNPTAASAYNALGANGAYVRLGSGSVARPPQKPDLRDAQRRMRVSGGRSAQLGSNRPLNARSAK